MLYTDAIRRAVTELGLTASTPRSYIQVRMRMIIGYDVSVRTLQRALAELQLTRSQLHSPSDAELTQAMRAHEHDTAELVGAQLMLAFLRQRHPQWRLSHERVRQVLRVLNPAAVVIRREIHVHPRIYRSRGPDDTWHFDQHDKLKQYGFPLHACIDGYSRKILWLVVVPSNNNPLIITDIYLNSLDKGNVQYIIHHFNR